jgi:DNA-binding MarR family transcriptional regulator
MPASRPRRSPTSPDPLDFMRDIWGLAHALDVRSKWMERNLGITGPQRLVVRVVGAKPDVTASEIAETLDLHPSTLTGILSRLELRGYLTRVVDPEDRRRARFRLTARGKKVDGERKGTVEAAVRRALSRATDGDVARARVVLSTLIRELEADV